MARARSLCLFLLSACPSPSAAVPPAGVEEAFPGRSGDPQGAVIATGDGERLATVEIIDGEAVLEGDILIDLAAAVERSTGRADARWRWTDGLVPFEIDPAIGRTQRGRILTAMDHWNRRTPYRLRPRRGEPDAVRFVPGPGCSSYVGRQGGVQPIALHEACSTGNIIHEIGHAVGLWHEQSRRDRDAHVVVHWEHIQDDRDFNFMTYDQLHQDGRDLGAYDLASIMHYGSYAFSADGEPTLTALDGSLVSGQRTALTAGDVAGATRLLQGALPAE